MRPELSAVKALTFDVFGTVVDWRGSIARHETRRGDDGLNQSLVPGPIGLDEKRSHHASNRSPERGGLTK